LRRMTSEDRSARHLLLLLALLCLSGVACNISGQPCGLLNESACAGANAGAGGAPAGFGCQMPGTNLWTCNLDHALGAPSVPFMPAPCGVVFCATNATNAVQQAAALAGVSADDSRLSCISLGSTVVSAIHNVDQATATFNAPGAVCVGMEGPGCNPCDDGQGGTLQSVGENCGGEWVAGQAVGPPAWCCAGLTCEGAMASMMGTCLGTLQPCAPKAPALMPLTTTQLRAIAATNNIGAGQTGITQSRTIGLAFENWALTTMGQVPRNTESFMSPLRQQQNNGLPASVIPEYVAGLNDWWPAQAWPAFPESLLFEVKAVTGVIAQSTSLWQILGLIDVASRSPAGVSNQPTPPATACVSTGHPNQPPPAIVFTTTGNTNLDLTMLQKATRLCVAIWQQIVMYDANTDPNNPDLYIDQALPANQAVYGAAVPLPMHPAWPHSPLTSPTSPPVPVPGDPDPPEVD
jgi:hypothetical protein